MTMFWILCTALAIPRFLYEIRGYLQRSDTIIGSDGLSFENYLFISFSVNFVLLFLVMVFHLFADQRPTASLYCGKSTDKQCPELHSSFVRRMFYTWFDSVMWKSYHKPLSAEDMFELRPEDMSTNMNPRFEKYWQLEMEKKANKAQPGNVRMYNYSDYYITDH